MEHALYHPQFGYYASGRARIGRDGDFFTNVSIGSIFGKLLAAQFAEIWDKLGRPADFKVVEQGAHDGQFAVDVLQSMQSDWGECFGATEYIILEPFEIWRERQNKTLSDFPSKVRWETAIQKIEAFCGVHFSNELFDALPVRLFQNEGGKWNELFVVEREGDFHFESRLCDQQTPSVKNGDLIEIAEAAPALMAAIAAKISRGVILTIDYGFTREEFFAPHHRKGTLQVRARHRKLDSPLEQIGGADISAHVEWTSLFQAGTKAGAQMLGFTDQHHFLTGLLTKFFAREKLSAAEKRGLQTILHPEMLGRSFQALALGKNFTAPLSGFRFMRPLA